MDFSNFIKSTFDDDRINVNSLNAILQIFASKLHLENLEFDPQKPLEKHHDNFRENFDIVNLSKRVEGVEEVTKKLLNTFESVKAANVCICEKLEETRVFSNKIFDEVMKLKSSENVKSSKCEENKLFDDKILLLQDWQDNENAKIQKLEEMMEQKLNDEKTQSLAISVLDRKFEKFNENFWKLENVVDKLTGRIEDLTFACEQLDGKTDEIDRDVQDFNARISCLKCETKKNSQQIKILCEKSENLQRQFDFLDDEKASKSHVEEFVDGKLAHFTTNETFSKFKESISENITLIDHDLNHMTQRCNILFAKLQNQINKKLNIDEVSKFKQNLQKNFNNFIVELEKLLNNLLMSGQEGAAGKMKLSCLSCDTEISMRTKTEGLPKLKSASNRFNIKMGKFPVRKYNGTSRSDILDLLEARVHDGKCFIISKDRSIFKADSEKCANNIQYQKTGKLLGE